MAEDDCDGTRIADPFFYVTFDQRRAIERWQDADWIFLHWTEVPRVMAVLENTLGDVVFIDGKGWAWKGPNFSKSRPVPLEKWPSKKRNDWL